MPDAAGVELIAQELRDRVSASAVVATSYYRQQASIEVRPEWVRAAVGYLKTDAAEPFGFLASLHGCDYYPHEPRLGVHYQLLSFERCERLGLKTRVSIENPEVPSVVELYPTANFQEREVYDFFGVVFSGHPDLRRIEMPEDYEGHPQRRDYPIGGEPVLFTYNENKVPRWYDE